MTENEYLQSGPINRKTDTILADINAVSLRTHLYYHQFCNKVEPFDKVYKNCFWISSMTTALDCPHPWINIWTNCTISGLLQRHFIHSMYVNFTYTPHQRPVHPAGR